jgi:hypothetical protein
MKQFLKPLHLACLADDTRPNMKLIQIKDGVATTTNGHILVRIDLRQLECLPEEDLEILNGKYIHLEVWKEIHKCDELTFDDVYIYCKKTGITKIFEYSEPQGEFFSIDSIIEDVKTAPLKQVNALAFNPKFYTTIAKIFETERLDIIITENNMLNVHPSYDSGMFALLAPFDTRDTPPLKYVFTNY